MVVGEKGVAEQEGVGIRSGSIEKENREKGEGQTKVCQV